MSMPGTGVGSEWMPVVKKKNDNVMYSGGGIARGGSGETEYSKSPPPGDRD